MRFSEAIISGKGLEPPVSRQSMIRRLSPFERKILLSPDAELIVHAAQEVVIRCELDLVDPLVYRDLHNGGPFPGIRQPKLQSGREIEALAARFPHLFVRFARLVPLLNVQIQLADDTQP